MQLLRIKYQTFIVLLVLISITTTVAQDYDDYARRNRRRRPQQQHTDAAGPCGRFFSYVNLNYNVDCGGGHGGGGSIDDFLGGHRPQKPHRPLGGGIGGGIHGGTYGDNQGGLFNRPIWGPIGHLASNIGNTVGSFANGVGNGGGGGGGHFFDGSIINSFASLFTNNNSPASGSSSPSFAPAPLTNRPTTQPDGFPSVEPHPVVPIVDLRPVHEDYYDEVTEATIYAPFGGSHHHNHNGGLFDINYNKAFKKINRQFNQAFNYLFKR